jgi:hypothetical protein
VHLFGAFFDGYLPVYLFKLLKGKFNMDKIIQIIPVSGEWFIEHHNELRRTCWYSPIACWALVEDETGDRYVVPMVHGDLCLEPVEESSAKNVVSFITSRFEIEEEG